MKLVVCGRRLQARDLTGWAPIDDGDVTYNNTVCLRPPSLSCYAGGPGTVYKDTGEVGGGRGEKGGREGGKSVVRSPVFTDGNNYILSIQADDDCLAVIRIQYFSHVRHA